MFVSWAGQNIYQSGATARMSDIQESVQFVNADMSKAIQWMLAFQNELRKEKPDPEIILNSSISYADTVDSIVAAAHRVDPKSAALSRHESDFKKLDEPLRRAAHSRDLKEIESSTVELMLWFKLIGAEAHDAISAKANELKTTEDRGRWIFQSSFIVASLLFAATWLYPYASSKQPGATNAA